MAHAQVRLFLVAPTDRQIHHPPPSRKSLRDFDHVKLNCGRQFCDRQSMVAAPALRGALVVCDLFPETGQY
jgi:hypothetical protein